MNGRTRSVSISAQRGLQSFHSCSSGFSHTPPELQHLITHHTQVRACDTLRLRLYQITEKCPLWLSGQCKALFSCFFPLEICVVVVLATPPTVMRVPSMQR